MNLRTSQDALHARPSDPAPAPLELSIESLELRGLDLDRIGAERLRAAMSAELEDLLSRRGADALRAGRFELGPLSVRLRAGDAPETMGRALARGLIGPAEPGEDRR